MSILERILELSDKEYAIFQSKLTPNIPADKFVGIRVPDARKLAKELAGTPEADLFLKSLPHKYYDEDMLHGLLLSEIKDYDLCIAGVEDFLPYVDNWAVCDIMSPKIFKKNTDKLICKLREWIASDDIYTCRFGVDILMKYYLDDNFKPEYLELAACLKPQDYYIDMVAAWFFATALAKQWEAAIPYLEEKRLSDWVHNKTIQKGVESYRITSLQKEYLKSLRIKNGKKKS